MPMMMMMEHEAASERLAGLRAVTLDDVVPEDACRSYALLFETSPSRSSREQHPLSEGARNGVKGRAVAIRARREGR